MRRKKSFWALGLALAVVPLISTQLLAAEAAIKLEYCNTMASLSTNTIGNKLKITNTSGQVINLEDLIIRYYYTVDEPLGQSLWCDHAGMMGSKGYETITSLITHEFVTMNTPTETADTYAQIGFKEGISQLTPNGNIEVQLRFTNSSWKNYNQANDYSYEDTKNSYVESDRVCLYYQDVLISGTEPRNEGVVDATVSPQELTFDKNGEVTSDCKTSITFNGNTLASVKNNGVELTAEDYAVDETNSLTFSNAYLGSLAVGDYQVVVNFSAGKSSVLHLQVVDTTDYDFAMVVSGINLTAGEERVIPVMIKNIPSGINNANFVLNYDQEALEVEAVSAGEVVPNDAESFKYAVHKDLGAINVLFADAEQEGTGLMTSSGELMKVKIRAKKDFNGEPFNVVSKSEFADYDLKKLNVVFKVN